MSVRVTPLLRIEPGVAFKLENLQLTGSFKLRGAVEYVRTLAKPGPPGGLCTVSAGNHGAGLAYAARAAGIAVTVFVPEHTPQNKLQRIKNFGATVIVRGALYDECERHAQEFARSQKVPFVSPFDDEAVIAGNGDSLGRELFEQAGDLKRVIVPVGGGGMMAGLARTLGPKGIEVIGVEPETNCAMKESLARGAAITDYAGGETAAGPLEGSVCDRTFQYIKKHGKGVVLVSEQAMQRAVARLYREFGQIAEIAGAAAPAALWSGVLPPASGGTTVCIVSGGNIDDDALAALLRV